MFIEKQSVKVVEQFDPSRRIIKYSEKIKGKKNETNGDEEITRACLLSKLANQYGYDLDRIEIEHNYTLGAPKTKPKSIDMVVRDNEGDAFLFIELKSPKAFKEGDQDKTIREQLFKLAALEKEEGRKKSKVIEKNDVIMARSGVAIGKAAIVEESFDGVFADFTMRMRFNSQRCNPKFAFYYVRSVAFQYMVEIYKKGVQNQNISPSIVQEFPFPDICLDKQNEIVGEIENSISEQRESIIKIDKLRERIFTLLYDAIK